jgi:hypothetical protein
VHIAWRRRYFAEALTDEFVAAGKKPPTIGLVNTAIGGSMIEEWSLNTTLATCKNTSHIGAGQQMLWDQKVLPYLSMTVRGFLWYQVALPACLPAGLPAETPVLHSNTVPAALLSDDDRVRTICTESRDTSTQATAA